jgi:hypothetical protein
MPKLPFGFSKRIPGPLLIIGYVHGLLAAMMTSPVLRSHRLQGFGVALLLAAFAIVFAFRGTYRGHVTPFGEGIAPLARQGARNLASQIPAYKETGLNPIVVFPFAGPKGTRLADEVRGAIDARGAYDVIGQGAVEAFFRGMNIDLPKLSEEDARKYAIGLGAKAFVTGGVIEIDETANPPVLSFRAVFAATEGDFRQEFTIPAPGETLHADSTQAASRESGGVLAAFFGILGRTAAYLALCLATPFLLYPLTSNLLARNSNTTNAIMLPGYAVADTLILWMVLGVGALILAIGFLAALWLNYCACEWIERRRAGA